MRKLAGEYIEKLKNKLSKFDNLKEAFVSQIDTQHNFIVKNYNSLIFSG